MKRVVVIQGAPGVGKTTLARRLAKDLSIKLISKDDIKEGLYDTLGHPSDRSESELYGRIAIRAMYVGLDEFLKAGQAVIIEAPLLPAYALKDLAEVVKLDSVLQLYVHCDYKLHEERFLKRINLGERHPGHADMTIDAVAAQAKNARIPDIDTVDADTTNFTDIDYSILLEKVKHGIQGGKL